MTNETRNRIRAYLEELPHMKEKVFGALLMLVIAATVAVASSYAWVTLSRSPESTNIATTLAANGALEIALSNPGGTMPDEFDIDESLSGDPSVVVSNLQWGNLVNLSDPSYGIDNLALRPAQLNTTALLTSPLLGAVYGEDGRITGLDSNYAYAKYNGSQFLTTDEYGVRAIATYKNVVSDSTRLEYEAKVKAVRAAQTDVYQTYADVAPKFSALGTMISKYAQNKLDDGYTNLAPYISDMLPLYYVLSAAMEKQMTAYVALANLQLYTNEQGSSVALTWDDLYRNKTQYNTASADQISSNGTISLVGLTQFIKDYEQLQKDIEHLEMYQADYETSGAAYYWGGYRMDGETKVLDNSVSGYALSNIVAHLIDYSSMTIDLNNDGTETKVVSLSASQAGALLGANGKERKVYAYNGILYRFEQSAVHQDYRINGKAACTIKVTYIMTITVYGKAYTKASGPATFEENVAASLAAELAPKDAVAEDTYGLAVDLWVRTNAETTCLTLEGATSTDEQGNIVSYDGVNRVWGATGEAVLTTDSTTQGGGSCYIYYADTPEDMARSLELLNAMKVAFISASGDLLATAEMDTANYWAVNGRITVPLVLDNQTKTTYTYIDSMNAEQVGRAVTTLYTDVPVRVTAVVYLDGTRLTNDHVLAAAEIQGSLNIQFGSSVDLETMGSDELIDDVRTVTATVSPSVLDYDKATSDIDMTTQVTVNIEGQSIEPTNVTAFFVRAINSTQGTREPTMTFTKDGGRWVCNYKFTAPGIYYLRQVRLDGVDYALAEPQRVEVKGFGLSSVTWSESGNDVTIRTSEGTHSTLVTVQFAADDRSKLPVSVQARFVRADGNTVNVPLVYNANGDWTGIGTFSASGVYQLQYLVADGRYIDLALNDGTYRTMDLSLGMYVTVDDLSGGLWEEYEEGKTYPKHVAVRIYNNAGVELGELENLILRFSNGTSSSNSISTNLTWDELNSCYTGTLPITDPGRYQFLSVQMGNNFLNKFTESPVYTIISPDPPTYDGTKSGSTYTGENIQFVPLTNDAVIDGIFIEHATSAVFASAVVYSAEADSYLTAPMAYGNGSWYVQLPTYDGEQIGENASGEPIYEQLQDGQWSLAAIRLWGCYDSESDFRQEDNPILWVASGDLGQNYLNTLDDDVTPDAAQDFTKLTTTVSAKVNVTMVPGNTALGSSTTPFGTVFHVSNIGMSVELTDGAGRTIPKDKIEDITLNLTYDSNTDLSYGYQVSGYNVGYAVKLNTPADAETGMFTVSGTESWWYVGKYTVKNLTITIGTKTLTYTPGNVGVPAQYTITTAAPTADNIKLDGESVKQSKAEFGGTSDNVTGTFLQAYDLTGTNVTIRLTGASGQEMSNAVVENLGANLVLTYQGGSQDKGGYTFTGDTGYQNLVLPMTAATGSNLYRAPGSQTLLAGIYKAQLQVTVGNSTELMALKNITVWSVRPDVKITGVSTTDEVTVNKNTDPATNHLTANADTFKARNQFGDYYAVVYMAYEPYTVENNTASYRGVLETYTSSVYSEDYAHYTAPTITVKAVDCGTAETTLTVGNNSVTFGNGGSALTVGSVRVGEYTHKEATNLGQTGDFKYKGDTATLLGTVTIDEVTSTVGGATYTRALVNPLIISQLNQENPTLTWSANGVTIKVTDGKTTYTHTADIPALTSLTATVTANNGYYNPTLTQPTGTYDWKLVRSSETEAVYTFKMAMGNSTLRGSAAKYPTITFNGANYATVAVTVNDIPITSNTGAKAGATVVVTLTTSEGFCLPRLTAPVGAPDWTVVDEGEFKSVYTFNMPPQAISLAAPTTTAMARLNWEANPALTFYVEDSTGVISNGSYVVPNHVVTVRLTATGGVNPKLTKPSGIENWTPSEGDFVSTYTFVMPTSTVTLTGTAEAYPALNLDNSFATFAVADNGIEREYAAGTGVSIKPGNPVIVTLTAKNGYYNPRMTAPSDVANWSVVSEDVASAKYSFTMPNVAVSAGSNISATKEPTVTFEGSNVTISISVNGTNKASGSQVRPGTLVTITATPANGYNYPTVAVASGTASGFSGTPTDSIASYTFTMGETDVKLVGEATRIPTVTWKNGIANDTKTQVYYMENGSKVVIPANVSTAVPKDTTVYVIVPSASRAGGGMRNLTGVSAGYATDKQAAANVAGEYHFVMESNDVTFEVYQSQDVCVTEDTLITLADGSQVRVDSLTGDEQLLVWNHVTGQFDTAPIAYLIDHGGQREETEVIHLYFSDGSDLEIVNEHVFYHADSGKYITLDENAVDYIGNGFAKQNLETGTMDLVQLTDVVFETKVTGVYEVVTYSYMTCFTDGILTASAYIENLLNVFDIDTETMAYDPVKMQRDIETYGLYTYEDLSHIVNEEQFYMHNGPVTKVAVGKGTITHEEMMALVKLFEAYAKTPGAE